MVVVAGHDFVRVGDYSTSLSSSCNDDFDEPERLCTILFKSFCIYQAGSMLEKKYTSTWDTLWSTLSFWSTLMLWKLLFSYVFEVYSMVLSSIQLTDGYVNYPNQALAR
jgi:hypothetical protein